MRRKSEAGRRREPPRSVSGSGLPSESQGERAWRPNLIGILLRAARDLWNESFFLMAFNFLFAVSALPGFLVLSYAVTSRQIVLAGIGLMTLLAWPFTTFGLFHAAARAVARDPLHLRTFVEGGRRRLGLAYRWGGLNVVVLGVLVVNAFFYLDPQAPLFGTWLGSFLAAFFLMACVVWVIGQAGLLAVLATLEVDSLRSGWKELRLVLLRRPWIVFGAGALCAVLVIASAVVLPLGLLLGFACAAVLACRMIVDLTDDRPATAQQFSRQPKDPR
ncbi:MAG: hypothetical protein HW404_288 [Anaerolineales bacterium]|nr:hypothetical protein [Anaerolineales bacterium]